MRFAWPLQDVRASGIHEYLSIFRGVLTARRGAVQIEISGRHINVGE